MVLSKEAEERRQRKARMAERNAGAMIWLAILMVFPFAWHAYGWLWSFAGDLF